MPVLGQFGFAKRLEVGIAVLTDRVMLNLSLRFISSPLSLLPAAYWEQKAHPERQGIRIHCSATIEIAFILSPRNPSRSTPSEDSNFFTSLEMHGH